MQQIGKTSGLHAAIRECSSWNDIRGKLRDSANKEKGDVFEELVKAYSISLSR